MEVKIGCCGFPISMKRYFSEFNIVEIQSTFYRFPKENTVKRWREQASGDFEFSIKAFQGITHDVDSPTWKKSGIKDYKNLKGKVGFLRPTKDVFEFWNETLKIAKILNSKIIVIQLPASFKDTEENIKNAYKFFSEIDCDKVRISVELRGWSEINIKKLCERFDLIDVIDPFVRKPTYINDICYFRLHGKYEGNKIIYRHRYSDEELIWLKNFVESLSAKEVYVMFNNSNMYEDAKRFEKIIE